jgi:hypothetical protein
MEKMGNIKANEFWEANLPKDYPRPNTEDIEGLSKFIRLKYVCKKWAANDAIPHRRRRRNNNQPSAISREKPNDQEADLIQFESGNERNFPGVVEGGARSEPAPIIRSDGLKSVLESLGPIMPTMGNRESLRVSLKAPQAAAKSSARMPRPLLGERIPTAVHNKDPFASLSPF